MKYQILKQNIPGGNIAGFNLTVVKKVKAVTKKGKEKLAVMANGVNDLQKDLLTKFEKLRNLRSLF